MSSEKDPWDDGDEAVPVGDHECYGDRCWCKQMKRRKNDD